MQRAFDYCMALAVWLKLFIHVLTFLDMVDLQYECLLARVTSEVIRCSA